MRDGAADSSKDTRHAVSPAMDTVTTPCLILCYRARQHQSQKQVYLFVYKQSRETLYRKAVMPDCGTAVMPPWVTAVVPPWVIAVMPPWVIAVMPPWVIAVMPPWVIAVMSLWVVAESPWVEASYRT